TAALTPCRISTARSTCSTPSSLLRWPLSMACTAFRAPPCTASMICWISAVDSAVRRARLRTSSATTAKPRPASPARAASMAALDGLHRVARAALDRLVELLDLGGGFGGAAGQVAHLVGHHREAAAGFPGPRRLDGRVEGQQVGLLGDAVDDFQHRADARAVI